MRRSSSDPALVRSNDDTGDQQTAVLPLPQIDIAPARYKVRCGCDVVLSLEEAAPLSVVWESGTVVAEYVQDESVFPRGSFRGKHVLDLGAGTGITSLTFALLGATVMATDIPESLPLLQRYMVGLLY